ncbi:MAG: hypothetical protein ABW123_27985 [Cystobacter sp.]
MNRPPFLLENAEVGCYPSADDPATFLYLPTRPVPQRTPQGLALKLLRVKDQAFLNLGAVWHPSRASLEALREALPEHLPGLERDTLRLQPARLQVDTMVLTLRADADGQGGVTLPMKTLNQPPYTTMFSAPLDVLALERVLAALERHERGLLTLTLRYRLHLEVSARARLEGDVGPVLGTLPPGASEAESRAWLDAALSAGHLRATRESRPEGAASARLLAEAEAQVRASALRQVHQAPGHASRAATYALSVEAQVKDREHLPPAGWLESTTDLAAWAEATSFRL